MIERYKATISYNDFNPNYVPEVEMIPASHGAWVRYDDVVKLVQSMTEQLRGINEIH